MTHMLLVYLLILLLNPYCVPSTIVDAWESPVSKSR